MREVARQAGVSVATVSRALNASGPVGEETRRRILETAERLRYVPNRTARNLKRVATETIGVLLPDLYGGFYSEVIRGAERAARAARYHTLLASAHDGLPELVRALRTLVGRVDGLVVMSPDIEADVLRKNLPPGLPVVVLGGAVAGHGSVAIDNAAAAEAVTRHLAGLGHRRIALVSGPAPNADARARRDGYRRALAEADLAPDPVLELAGDFTEASGRAAAASFLALSPRPTALFCANDAMAVGALQALRDAGLRVPADVALAGFDDIPLARYVTPALTTAHVPIDEMGSQAIDAVLRAVRGDAPAPPAVTLPTRLVVRESCGARL
ncbi:LacI family DNA-binding transcriptional regulator [Rubrivirga sp. S365]|uniref:LacI family DNA-binding transcriptional regulator n=1 Tax=Rubrivirga litoralis TaxID=3075598 RepID=A0ABU3BP27_9BACT|nr:MULTISPECIES: LacI family DNA-binding transcriptional regulator [unclassified Rubrivirga]MDT0631013.1 LacI family DNA-binding transcriptional regulator [Rubrivirga sp. F394]MDT7855039.1 LacI family DNA-binding transcriptional regulator [Rubrivirga sp. S365]